MPLPLQTSPEQPNTIIISQIVLQTGVQAGNLVTSAIITLEQAKVTAEGVWTNLGNARNIVINDIANLESDLAVQQESINTLMSNIISIVGEMNQIRKVL